MSDETVVSEISEDTPEPKVESKPAPKPEPKPEPAVLGGPQASDADKAMKLWEHCNACLESGNEIIIRDRSGLNTVLDINNI